MKLGFDVEYERPFAGKTPDWYVQQRGTTPAFAVEVFSVYASNEESAEAAKWNHLAGCLRQIPASVALDVQFLPSAAAPDPKHCKIIAKAVEDWVMKGNRAPGDQLEERDIIFTVLHRSPQLRSLALAGPGPTHGRLVDLDQLKKGLDKVSRYNGPLHSAGVPLVLAFVADFTTFRGERAVESLVDRLSGEVSRPPEFEDPIVSAMLWITHAATGWEMEPVFNPNALWPLPKNAFGPWGYGA